MKMDLEVWMKCAQRKQKELESAFTEYRVKVRRYAKAWDYRVSDPKSEWKVILSPTERAEIQDRIIKACSEERN